MATRRNVASAQTEQPQHITVNQPAGPSDVTPAVPKAVIVKLLAFTFAMVVLPISSYFLTVQTIFKGNSSLAGGLAAVVANVVLVGYVVVAYWDDQSERLEEEGKKRAMGKAD